MLNLLTFKYVACYISATSTIGHTLFATFHMFIHLTSRQFFGKAYLFYTLGVCLPLHLFRVKSGFDNDDDGALIFFMCCDFILLILKEYIWMIKITEFVALESKIVDSAFGFYAENP